MRDETFARRQFDPVREYDHTDHIRVPIDAARHELKLIIAQGLYFNSIAHAFGAKRLVRCERGFDGERRDGTQDFGRDGCIDTHVAERNALVPSRMIDRCATA